MHNPPVILIADDDPGFQEIVGTKLKRNGFAVAEAHDGKEAVEKAKNLHPDLIVMDINMPNENGTEAVLDMKANPETRDIKIVFFTSEEDPWPGLKGERQHSAVDLGAQDFIRKNDDLDVMVEKIKSFLKGK
ncbi:MAG: response regulator [Patescibacteria group bacterium]